MEAHSNMFGPNEKIFLFILFIYSLFIPATECRHDWKVIQMLLGCPKPTAVDSLTANSKFSADADE